MGVYKILCLYPSGSSFKRAFRKSHGGISDSGSGSGCVLQCFLVGLKAIDEEELRICLWEPG